MFQEKIIYSRTKEIKLVEFVFKRQTSGNKKASSECGSGDSCNLHNVHFTSKTGSDSKDQSWYLYLYFIFSCPWRLASNSKAQTWQFWCFMCFTCVIKYLLFFNSNIQGWKMLFVYFSSFFSLSHLYFVWQISTLLSLSHGFVCPTFLPDPILECARHKITSSDISKLSFGLILVVWFWHTSTLFGYIVRLDVKWCNGYTPLTLNNMCSCATLPCNLNEIYLLYLLTLNDENAKHSYHSSHSTTLSNGHP